MRPCRFLSLIPLLFLGVQQSARAQDILVPAGTLLRCTLNEPDFSSKSAKVGDPVVCNVSTVQEFGRATGLPGPSDAAPDGGCYGSSIGGNFLY